MTDTNQSGHQNDEIALNLGTLAIDWNRLELLTKWMLHGLAGGEERTAILTAHMGAITLTDALRTLAAEFAAEEIKPHIEHFLEAVGRLRGYRNHYIHGIIQVVGLKSGPVGYSETLSAKARLIAHKDFIEVKHLTDCIAQIRLYCDYGHDINSFIFQIDKRPGVWPRPSFPQKPPMPDRLLKPRLTLLDELRPPPSSPE